MHDHNLDDLIIGNIEPENNKTKSFLTIVALLIVVMIVAIILTKILLKTPDTNKLAFEENMTEMIAPELKLQEATKEEKPEKEPSLSSIVESEISPPATETKDLAANETANETVKETTPSSYTTEKVTEVSGSGVDKEISAEAQISIAKEEVAKEEVAKDVSTKKELVKETIQDTTEDTTDDTTDETVEITKEYTQAPEPTKKPVVKSAAPKIAPSQTHYIQVGSFTQDPSERFLTAIKNSGFSYVIADEKGNGSKKLLIGPYNNRQSADSALIEVKDRINKSAFVIKK